MAIDYSVLALAKPTPRAMVKATKRKANERDERSAYAQVDERDKRRCQLTGRSLSAGAVEPWSALERHHVALRSLDKGRRYSADNILTVSRAIHQLLHSGALRLLTTALEPAKSVPQIAYVAWNRNMVPKLAEPCRLKPQGRIKRAELDKVHD